MVSDGLLLIGAGLIVGGIAWWSPPVAVVVSGVIVSAIGVSLSKGGRHGRTG